MGTTEARRAAAVVAAAICYAMSALVSLRRRWGVSSVAIALCAAAAGCSSKNEIVATQRSTTLQGPDGSIYLPPPIVPCEPGSYSGLLFSIPGDGGIKIQYSGSLSFSITQSMSGEFKVTDDTAQLAGMGMDGTSFAAEIANGRCMDGVVHADLTMGKYTYFTNLEKTATSTFDFDGSISGHYDATYAAFVGDWTTALHLGGNYGDLVVAGKWQAYRTR